MNKKTNTKRTLIVSGLSMLLCVTMLVGSTFAWFTDTASTSVNTIQAGTLDVQLLDADGNSLEGQTLSFVKAEGGKEEEVLWEPGATYRLQPITIKNNGNLALKYKVEIAGIQGDAELNNVIIWTITDGTSNGEGHLAANASADLTISGTMSTEAGNEYMGKKIENVSITVLATQDTVEHDSNDNLYDQDSKFTVKVKDVEGFISAVKTVEDGGTILITEELTVTGTTDGDLSDTGKTTNIDFNGKTVYGDNDNIAFRVRGNSVGNLRNGTIIAMQGTYSAVSANEDAVANVSNMTLKNVTANGNGIKAFAGALINVENTTVDSENGGGAEAAGGIINITNCTFTQTGYHDANSMNVAASNGGTAKIYSGTFTGENYGLYVFRSGGTINVYGGTFQAATVLMADSYVSEPDCIFNIYGGSFTGAISISEGSELNITAGTFANTGLTSEQFHAYVAEGSTVTENNGVFTVTK